MKTTVSEINTMNETEVNNRLYIAEEKISELGGMVIETIQNNMQRVKDK